jgi:sugar/nucleoside kinase (ribokinase family)
MTIVGDVMLDIVAIPETPARLDKVTVDYLDAAVNFHPGGTGLNLALAATNAGFAPVHLVCSLGGPTWVRTLILNRLRAAGAEAIVNTTADARMGIAIIGYLNGQDRVMLGDAGANRLVLSSATVRRACAVLRRSGVLIVSGYTLFRESTAPGVRQIMAAARACGAAVVLDLVPHTVYRTLPPGRFEALLPNVDYLSADINTLLGLAGAPRWPGIGIGRARRIVTALLRQVRGLVVYLEDRTYWVVTRLGSHDGALDQPADPRELRGQTDRVLITVLSSHLLPSHEWPAG